MRIFVVGGTGILGKRVVNDLVEKGNKLLVLSRNKDKSNWITDQGAEPIEADLFNLDDMNSCASNQDGIINLATSIPKKMKTKPKDWQETKDIRDKGKRILIQASLNNQCKFFIQESFLLVYGNQYGKWVDESDSITKPVPLAYKLNKGFHDILNNAVLGEEIIYQVTKNDQLPSIVLRYGVFYASDASTTIDMVNMMRKHRFPIIGKGDSFTNPIHVDDAASATVQAVENYRKAVGKVFNICDNEPVLIKEFFSHVAKVTGSKDPMKVPLFIAKFAVDPYILNAIFSSVRCKNNRARDVLNWELQYPTYREGFTEVINKNS